MKKFFKYLLLRNRWSEFGIISQGCSLCDPFQNLFAKFWSVEKHGHHGGPFLHIYTHFNTVKKYFKKILWKKVKLLNMSKFTFFHNVFYAICIFKSFHSHISVVVCSFFEFGAISKWYIQKWINVMSRSKQKASQIQIFPVEYACFQLLGR